MGAVAERPSVLACRDACAALGVPRASFYRAQARPFGPRPRRTPGSARALSPAERAEVLAVVHEPRFVDLAVPQVHAQLLDEGRYLASPRTMYRVLAAQGEVRERRDQLRRPVYTKPELLAEAPNQVWSWDITRLRGPAKWTFFSLYVLLDIFSRYAVGWLLARCESAALACQLVGTAARQQRIGEGQLTVHADRGAPMKSKPLALLLADLDVGRSFSRPHVSDDNPFSEAHFRTLKYRPDFPARFGSLQDARAHCARFFDWYHHEHRHSGLAWHTPADVHYGRAADVRARRAAVLGAAYGAHPERFVHGPPSPPALPAAVWINPPAPPREPAAAAP
jgi:putative transposase